MKPIRPTFPGCCASAASGAARRLLLSPVRNARRFTGPPRPPSSGGGQERPNLVVPSPERSQLPVATPSPPTGCRARGLPASQLGLAADGTHRAGAYHRRLHAFCGHFGRWAGCRAPPTAGLRDALGVPRSPARDGAQIESLWARAGSSFCRMRMLTMRASCRSWRKAT